MTQYQIYLHYVSFSHVKLGLDLALHVLPIKPFFPISSKPYLLSAVDCLPLRLCCQPWVFRGTYPRVSVVRVVLAKTLTS